MNYFIVYFMNGNVVDICCFDDEESRNLSYCFASSQILNGHSYASGYNSIQMFDQVR